MRVVHVINRLLGGGAEVMVPQIHRELRGKGIESWIVSMETGDDRGTEAVRSFGRRLPRWREPTRLRRELVALAKERGPIDVLHTHLTQSQLFTPWAARALQPRPALVTTEHDTANRRTGKPWLRGFDRRLYRPYDRIACISEGVAAMMRSWQPTTADRLQVLPNGVDLRPYRSLARSGRAPGAPLRLLSVGRLIPKKNHRLLVEALAPLRGLPWQLTIVGEEESPSWLRGDLERAIAEAELADRIHLPGYASDPLPYYAEADLFLFPSISEGFGLVAVEAMAAGLPVLASEVPGLAEVVGREGAGGQLLPAGDPEAWRQALQSILADPESLEPRRALARQRAEHFSIEKTATAYAALYRECLEGGREG